jgi:hypothetical protein
MGFRTEAGQQTDEVAVIASPGLRASFAEMPRISAGGFLSISVGELIHESYIRAGGEWHDSQRFTGTITQLGFVISNDWWLYASGWGSVITLPNDYMVFYGGSYGVQAWLNLGPSIRLWGRASMGLGLDLAHLYYREPPSMGLVLVDTCVGIDWFFSQEPTGLQLEVGLCLTALNAVMSKIDPGGLFRNTWSGGGIGVYVGFSFGSSPAKQLLDPWKAKGEGDRWLNAVTGKIETVNMTPASQSAISNQAPERMKAQYRVEVVSNDRIDRIGQRLLKALKELEAEINALLEESRKNEERLISNQVKREITLTPRNVRWQRNIRFFELQTSTPNAFSLGDSIFVTTGLLKPLDDDQLAAVLGHEIAHSVFRDTPQALEAEAQRNLILLIVALITGSHQTVERWDTIFELTLRSRSRDKEHEADTFGFLLGCRANFNKARMVTIFDVLAGIEILEGASDIPIYLRTHPQPQKRKIAADKACQLPKWWRLEPTK